MESRDKSLVVRHFSNVEDPRANDRRRKHKLADIMVLAICGVICGADDWVTIARFARDKKRWFGQFLELPHGIPSHDTFRRVFMLLNPHKFAEAFVEWIRALSEGSKGALVALDGKTLRRSFDRVREQAPIHLISAWCTKNRMTLGQYKVDGKSNEITAIPKLLELLDLRDCTVTIDAMGCQKSIAGNVRDAGADYMLALKSNHGDLYEDVKLYFETQASHDFAEFSGTLHQTVDADHGRIETRKYAITADIEWTGADAEWKDLAAIGMVEATREINGKTSLEQRFYLTSFRGDAKQFAELVRGHWQIENCAHWILDVAFREDDSRARAGNSAENFALLRRIALNLLKNETSIKLGVKNKRLCAGWSEEYLLKVLAIGG
jgi:predicted transposase YbfD/YdcC